ncbi:MAG: putative capsid protein [Cressdnaviricota sp.]|nr:MAG: putative capsid protein [Cressdnaviricota sp.]
MPYKRKYVKKPYKKKISLSKKIDNVLKRKCETQLSINNVSANLQYGHNETRAPILNDLLQTVQGTGNQVSQVGNRVGDHIQMKGLSIRMLLEKNTNIGLLRVRIMVIKTRRGYFTPGTNLIPTTDIYRQASGSSTPTIMDYTKKRVITVLYSKWITIKETNAISTAGVESAQPVGGVFTPFTAGLSTSKNSYYLNTYLTAKQLGLRSGNITYEPGSTNVKDFDYSIVLVPYVSYDYVTGTTCMRVNDCITTMYYIDP